MGFGVQVHELSSRRLDRSLAPGDSRPPRPCRHFAADRVQVAQLQRLAEPAVRHRGSAPARPPPRPVSPRLINPRSPVRPPSDPLWPAGSPTSPAPPPLVSPGLPRRRRVPLGSRRSRCHRYIATGELVGGSHMTPSAWPRATFVAGMPGGTDPVGLIRTDHGSEVPPSSE